MTKPSNIPFIDLHAQREHMGQALENRLLEAVRAGQYIMGSHVKDLEQALQEFTGAKHCISCSNGTDALALYLMAKGLRPGQAVFVPSFTFVATAEVVAWLGTVPFFVDVEEDSFNMDPASLERAIEDARQQGLKPSGVIAVDLFGQPANYTAINAIAKAHDMWVMADAAQSFGSSLNGKMTGTLADVTSTSFFPAKPLGCYGDGGALFTDDEEMAATLDSLRVHGKGTDKYDNVRIGMNGRLDTLQAAILLEKMKIFPEELMKRQAVADCYHTHLKGHVKTPQLKDGATSAWAQYTLILPDHIERDDFMAQCKAQNVPTMVYYPIPLSKQKAYSRYPSVSGGTPVSERLSQKVVSLPMHPYMTQEVQGYIVDVVKEALGLAQNSQAKRA